MLTGSRLKKLKKYLKSLHYTQMDIFLEWMMLRADTCPPACDWNNFGTIRYDEMTALQLAKKSSLMIGKSEIWKGLKDMNVSRVEWLNHVLKADW